MGLLPQRSQHRAPSQRRSILLCTSLCALSLFLAPLLTEAGLRLLAPHRTLGPIVTPDKSTGYRMLKNAETHYYLDGRYVPIRTNSLGLRQEQDPPADVKHKVLVLGDSFTFGWGVDIGETFFSLLSVKAQKRFGDKFFFLNGGHGAYGTKNMLAFLKAYGLSMNPSYILMFVGHNDVDDNIRTRFFFDLDEQDRLVSIPTPQDISQINPSRFSKIIPGYDWLMFNSYLLQLMRPKLRKLANRFTPTEVTERKPTVPAPPQPIEKTYPYKLTRELILEMKRICDDNRIQFTATNVGHATPRTTAVMDKLHQESLFDYFDVSNEFHERTQHDPKQFYLSDGHFNDKGNALFADLVWPHLERRLAAYKDPNPRQSLP